MSGSRFLAVPALVRWPNVLLAGAGVVVGAWWADEAAWTSPRVLLAMGAAMLITAFVNVTNDLADVLIDRVAHPHRPLARGAIDTRTARALAGLAALASLAASHAAGGIALTLVTLGVLAAAAIYSPWLKRHGMAGNVAVALLASMPFAYGAHAAGHVLAGLSLVLVSVPLHFARELAKDLDDAGADAAGGRVTLPHRVGAQNTRLVVAGAVVLHICLVMFLLVPRDPRGLALAPALIVASVGARRAGRPAPPGAPLLFKVSMLLAMAGLLALR